MTLNTTYKLINPIAYLTSLLGYMKGNSNLMFLELDSLSCHFPKVFSFTSQKSQLSSSSNQNPRIILDHFHCLTLHNQSVSNISSKFGGYIFKIYPGNNRFSPSSPLPSSASIISFWDYCSNLISGLLISSFLPHRLF